MSLLYISILAFSVMLEIGSSGFSFLNSFMVLLSPFSILSLRRVSLKKLPIASMRMSLKEDISLLDISSSFSRERIWLHSSTTSPVFGSTTSVEAILPTMSSTSTGIYLTPAATSFFRTSLVNFLSFFTMTSPVLGSFMSRLTFWPTRKSGSTLFNIFLFSRSISSLG